MSATLQLTYQPSRKKVISWAFYDWARSAFATAVMAGFFPVFFKEYWSAGQDVTVSTFRLGIANSFVSIIILILAPILGAIADKGDIKKHFLFFFALLGILSTSSLFVVSKGEWVAAAVLYILATVGYSGSNVFYDSLIFCVTEMRKIEMISALGYAFGYVGGALFFSLCVIVMHYPHEFGFADPINVVDMSFLGVSIWWVVFSIPLFLYVPEPKSPNRVRGWSMITSGMSQLGSTFREIRKLRMVVLFLVGYWFYIDGVNTIVVMSLDYGMALGFPPNSLITALLITQFVGFPAALVFGKIGEIWSAKTGIMIGLAVYIGAVIYGFFLRDMADFYVIAIVIGLVQGGVQSLSRAFFARIIPADKSAEFFGFYNMWGKFAAVVGPIMVGWVSLMTGNPRYSILSIIGLFIIGAGLLYFVDEKKGQEILKS